MHDIFLSDHNMSHCPFHKQLDTQFSIFLYINEFVICFIFPIAIIALFYIRDTPCEDVQHVIHLSPLLVGNSRDVSRF